MCWGFGHSINKCPTKRIFNDERDMNNVLKSSVSRSIYAIKDKNIGSSTTWPFYTEALHQANLAVEVFRPYLSASE